MGVCWYIVSPSTCEAFELGKWSYEWGDPELDNARAQWPEAAAFVAAHADSTMIDDTSTDVPWIYEGGWTLTGTRFAGLGIPQKLGERPWLGDRGIYNNRRR